MNEFTGVVQRKKTIGRISEEEGIGFDAVTTHCSGNAVEVFFHGVQAGTFAQSSRGERRWLVCIHPTVLLRKQPNYGESKDDCENGKSADGRSYF
jgi:hypothetical protein